MQLTETSLEWALVHLRRFYSSDFFPEPFEFQAVHTQWNTVKEHLLTLDISKHVPQAALRLLAPKPNGTFRVVHQLDPLDSLIYTALVHSVAAGDRAWVKSHKSGLDTLGPWDKRAVLFASQVRSADERRAWLRIAKARGDFLDRILATHLLAS
jgi:hypothetical protein